MSGKVGPGNPPENGRIRKGEKRNPAGRPKKEKKSAKEDASAFEVFVDRTVPVTRNGKERHLTWEEGLQLKVYKDALAGDRAAVRQVIKMIKEREKFRAKRRKRNQPSDTLLAEPEDPTVHHEALLLLDIASRAPNQREPKEDDDEGEDYVRVHLEPWAVQTALSRRRGGNKLTSQDVSSIKLCTRDPETLRWPRGTEHE